MKDELDARAEERLGRVLNEKWTLERLLGTGGMAAVYAGRHRNGARAAVKVLHPELARHADVVERFLREGYAANRVEHRGAVQVLDDDRITSGPDEGTAYLVMELLEGESLEDRAAREPAIREKDYLAIADGILEVLEAAHAHGVIHRDLKPDNIFLARDPDGGPVRVKILDFGLARLAEAERVTRSGLALGTPSFMSPEQASGRADEIDGRTDIFALGATGFRLLTGRRIHEAPNPVILVTKMANEPAPPIRSVAPQVSEGLARVIDRALAFKREDRYPDAASMRADIRALLLEATGGGGRDAVELLPADPHGATIELSRDDLIAASLRAGVPGADASSGSGAGAAAESGSGAGSGSAAASASGSVPEAASVLKPWSSGPGLESLSLSARAIRVARRSRIPQATVLLYALIFVVELVSTLKEKRVDFLGDADAGDAVSAIEARVEDPAPVPYAQEEADAAVVALDDDDDASADAEADDDDDDASADDASVDELDASPVDASRDAALLASRRPTPASAPPRAAGSPTKRAPRGPKKTPTRPPRRR